MNFHQTALVAFRDFIRMVTPNRNNVTLRLPIIRVTNSSRQNIIKRKFRRLTGRLGLRLTVTFRRTRIRTGHISFNVTKSIRSTVRWAPTLKTNSQSIRITRFTSQMLQRRHITIVTVKMSHITTMNRVAPRTINRRFMLQRL